MLQKFAQKFCEKIDSSPRIQEFIEITPRQEKIAKRLFLPCLAIVAWMIFMMFSAKAEAAHPDLRNFFTVHEINPILTSKKDSEGQPVKAINEVDLLVQLPGERVARRIRVPLRDTLFLDPRAPAPGELRYEAVIGLDGKVGASE